jgi:predicted DNA-binding antitoxin AbrB/MazE fold protein
MALTVDAVYENGMLKPAGPLPLQEHAKVRITVHPDPNWVDRTAGMIPWSGDMETLRRLAEDVEFDPQEGA